MTPLFIGLGHYSRTGKDTFANYIVKWTDKFAPHLTIIKHSFAWKLKQITYDLYGWAGMKPPGHYDTVEGAKDRDIVLPALGMTPVELWVAFGTTAVRNNVYQDTWLDYVLQSDHKANVVLIPDVRFPNEADAIKAAGGVLIKVVRPGYGPRNTVADRALLGYQGWDYVLGGDGSLATLEVWGLEFADWIAGHRSQPKQSKISLEDAFAVEAEVLSS